MFVSCAIFNLGKGKGNESQPKADYATISVLLIIHYRGQRSMVHNLVYSLDKNSLLCLPFSFCTFVALSWH